MLQNEIIHEQRQNDGPTRDIHGFLIREPQAKNETRRVFGNDGQGNPVGRVGLRYQSVLSIKQARSPCSWHRDDAPHALSPNIVQPFG